MLERRKSPRGRAYLGARIEFDNRSTMDCLIRDLSDDGAKLAACSGNVALPDRFHVFVAKHCAHYEALTVWRRQDEMGVRLLSKLRHGNVIAFDPLRRIAETLKPTD